ncbi:gliotoxin biosynthesis protein GliK [Paraphaeosphaeria sporulosa]|uniref:gamma-glutamylcyclotransferase n=1 Tax=Paraphaeosphaeria sporulosa TaxID=1460663 RepID=A0A177C0H6_9PLEO|nr:gliotoxin biosynthesis protein GliK [Paraphaeosphaeria sporulosa]OAG00342.1 gliotoxin biosynthesis protein GliK [Paraphaeosphaeria sporulosa]
MTQRVFPRISQTSPERRDASLTEPSFDVKALSPSDIDAASEKGKTILYLAYGSNLCKETFREKRGIKPLSQINVLVPSLRLTFDLPGVPYIEPCFGNSAMREPDAMQDPDAMDSEDYHKDRWKKGLVGCVYEVTPSDYAQIIATEGGGAGYQDILVDCYPLPDGDTVPEKPTTQRFLAHTLFAPPEKSHARPDPSYAQPSARYLNLITTGAAELSLPREYQLYLNEIRPYTITTKKQQMGKVLFASIWLPFLQLLFALNAQFQDDKGRSPPWLAQLAALLFLGIWRCYDGAFKKVFGDGERTKGGETSSKKGDEMDEAQWRRIGENNGWFRSHEKIEHMA